MKKLISTLVTFIIISSMSTSAFAYSFWYKGSNDSYLWKTSSPGDYNSTTAPWASATAHAFFDRGNSTGIQKIKVFARPDSVQARYPAHRVDVMTARAGFYDNDSRNLLYIDSAYPLVSTSSLTIPGLNYKLLGYTHQHVAFAIDIMTNALTGGVDHWGHMDRRIVTLHHNSSLNKERMSAPNSVHHSALELQYNNTRKGFTAHFGYRIPTNIKDRYALRGWGQVYYNVVAQWGAVTYQSGYATVNFFVQE